MTAEVTHVDAGLPWSGVGDARTLLDLVVPACLRDEAPAIEFEDGLVLSRSDLLDLTGRFAGYLRDRVSPGDVVAIMVGNRAEYMIAHLAVCAVRATLVSINPTAKEHDTKHILSDSAAVLAIVDPENRALVEGLRGDCPRLGEVLSLDEEEPRGLTAYESEHGPLDLTEAACEPDDVTHIYYTSGTTGLAKGCMLDHRWWLRCVDLELRLNPKGSGDRMLSCLPFYYADPAVMLACTIHSGGTLVVMRRFSVSRFWDVVRRHDVVDMWTIASMPALLLKAAPSPLEREHRVRLAIAVGVQANIHRELVERFGFPFLDNYGSTEATINTRMPRHVADEMVGSGSIGVAMPECEIRLVDADDEDVRRRSNGRDPRARARALPWLSQPPRRHRRGDARRLVPHRRPRAAGRARLLLLPRTQQGHRAPQRRERGGRGDRGRAARAPEDLGGRRDRRAGRAAWGGDQGLRSTCRRANPPRRSRRRSSCATAATAWRVTRCRATSSTATRTFRARRRCASRRRSSSCSRT